MEKAKVFDSNTYNNAKKFMSRYIQRKHLVNILDKWSIKKTTKIMDMCEDIINAVQMTFLDIEELRFWLSKSQIDGNNLHFIYDVNFKDVNELKLKQMLNDVNKHTKNILDINEENIKGTELIHMFKIEHKYVLSFLSPAEINIRKLTEDGSPKFRQDKIVYPAFLELDFKNNQVIVIINPTSNLVHVDGRRQGKYYSFAPIADLYLEQGRRVLGLFHVKKPQWLTNALFHLAEDLSYHNNPHVEKLGLEMESKIKDFAKTILEESDISDVALIDSLSSDIQDSFISVLQEEFGEHSIDTDYRVYMQKTDQAKHLSIEVESKKHSLVSGTIGRIAKQSRQGSDVKLLGLEVRLDTNNIYRFKIEDGEDHILIRSSNSFTQEEVVQNVLSKLREYKNGVPHR